MSIKKLTCKRCGYSWWPRTDKKPKLCPACKSRKYDEDKKMGVTDENNRSL
uniref:Rubredoxin-like domain-containing protein n=1 Tax=viral metagenome TaxID=1070528 RepID=A0A6M3LPS8_9ZZZZ